MSSSVSYKDKSVWMANRNFNTLIDLGVEAAKTLASTHQEHTFVNRMEKRRDEQFFNGYALEIEDTFENLEDMKFWCHAFCQSAQDIFLRKIGNQDNVQWQAYAIYLAYSFSTLLKEAIQEREPGWNLDTQPQT